MNVCVSFCIQALCTDHTQTYLLPEEVSDQTALHLERAVVRYGNRHFTVSVVAGDVNVYTLRTAPECLHAK